MKIKVIAEIGINHNGEKLKAFKLLQKAYDSGCWGVKFQYRSDDFFAINDEMGSTLIREELEKSNLNKSWIPELIQKSNELGIAIGFSFFRVEDLEDFFSKDLKIDFIKIPSPEFRNINLIKEAKKYTDCIMISYGGGEENEIIKAISDSDLRETDIVFHCISNYPIAIGNQQLSFLERLKKMTIAKTGYSSHDEDWEINLLAVTFGIEFIELHICESKNDIGLDITTSSEPSQIKKLTRILNSYDEILKCEKRIPNQGEVLNVRNLGTSLYSNVNLKRGDRLKNTHFIGKSPRIGLSYEEFNNIEDKILSKDIKIGEPLLIEHFEETKFKLGENLIKFSNDKRISLPVRLHDFKLFKDIFNFKHYEFHFSYKEIYHLAENGFSELLSIIDKSLTISIHLPDYISKDELINPFSNKSEVKDISELIINTCAELATEIKTKTGKECIILGSFSMNQFQTKAEFYSTFKTFIEKNEYKNNRIVAQWLPKKAWYFGGTVLVDLFCSKEDIDLCLEYDIPICLDIAHLILSANYYNENWKKWYDLLLPLCRHIHLSDAEGDDGEGVTFGKGDLHSKEEILDLDCIKVLEIWEGHHNSGKGFKEGLLYLSNK